MFSAWIAAFSAVFWIISFTWSTAFTDSFSEFIALVAIVFPLLISFIESSSATTNNLADQVENSHKEAEISAQATAQTTTMIEQNQEKMKLMMDAMNKIHQTSQQVVGIIQTIEDISAVSCFPLG